MILLRRLTSISILIPKSFIICLSLVLMSFSHLIQYLFSVLKSFDKLLITRVKDVLDWILCSFMSLIKIRYFFSSRVYYKLGLINENHLYCFIRHSEYHRMFGSEPSFDVNYILLINRDYFSFVLIIF